MESLFSFMKPTPTRRNPVAASPDLSSSPPKRQRESSPPSPSKRLKTRNDQDDVTEENQDVEIPIRAARGPRGLRLGATPQLGVTHNESATRSPSSTGSIATSTDSIAESDQGDSGSTSEKFTILYIDSHRVNTTPEFNEGKPFFSMQVIWESTDRTSGTLCDTSWEPELNLLEDAPAAVYSYWAGLESEKARHSQRAGSTRGSTTARAVLARNAGMEDYIVAILAQRSVLRSRPGRPAAKRTRKSRSRQGPTSAKVHDEDDRKERQEYLVQWLGYPPVEPHVTWQSYKAVSESAPELLEEYLSQRRR